MWIISRATKCVHAHVRKHDNDILVFQKTPLTVLLDCSTAHRASRTLPTWCVHVRAHMRVYSCIVLISRCQQRLAVGLDWYTADTPVTLRYERYGLAKTVPINYTRELSACAGTHVRVCVFIYRQIKHGRTMCYWKYAYIRGTVQSHAHAYVRVVPPIDDLCEMKNVRTRLCLCMNIKGGVN